MRIEKVLIKTMASLLLSCVLTFSLNAQSIDEEKFLGTWKWSNGSEELTVIFKRDIIPIDSPAFHTLVGVHRYKRNDTLMQNTIPLYMPSFFNWEGASILCSKPVNGGPNLITGNIADKQLGDMYFNVDFTFLYTGNQIKMNIYCKHCLQKGDGKTRLPNGIILTKQP
jgi:hypothetical protein